MLRNVVDLDAMLNSLNRVTEDYFKPCLLSHFGKAKANPK